MSKSSEKRLAELKKSDAEELHKKFIYPVVRVIAYGKEGAAGGSGVVVYSQDEETYLLTNHHVIANLIEIEPKWNSLAGKKIQVETRSEAICEFFDYENLSRITDANGKKADVVAWDEQRDLALLKLKATTLSPYVSPIMPRAEFDEQLFIGSEVRTVGCGMGVPPLMTSGHVGGFNVPIDNFPYTLCTAPSIFGNSGGPVYDAHTGKVIGLSARLNVVLMGLGGSPITHMSYSIPTETIEDFLKEQLYDFIVDSSVSREEQHAERKRLAERAYKNLVRGENEESK